MNDDLTLLKRFLYFLWMEGELPVFDEIESLLGDYGISPEGVKRLEEIADEAISQFSQYPTCPKCRLDLLPGIAIQSTLVGEEDDIGGCITLSYGGPGHVVDVLKCPSCGFSITNYTPKP